MHVGALHAGVVALRMLAQHPEPCYDPPAHSKMRKQRSVLALSNSVPPTAHDPAYAKAVSLLQEAADIQTNRATQHGGITHESTVWAEFMSTYLTARLGVTVQLTPEDFGICSALGKIARLTCGDRDHRDSYMDAANYMALAFGVRSGATQTTEKVEVRTVPGPGGIAFYAAPARVPVASDLTG